MKVLIWAVCIFVAAFVKALAFGNANLGAIPTLIIYGNFLPLQDFYVSNGMRGKQTKQTRRRWPNFFAQKNRVPVLSK